MGPPLPSIISSHNSLPNYLPRHLWSLKRKWESEPSVMLLVCLEHQVAFLPWTWGSISKRGHLLKGWPSAQHGWPFSFVCSSHTLPRLRRIRKFGVRYIEFKYSESRCFYCAERQTSKSESSWQRQWRKETGEVTAPRVEAQRKTRLVAHADGTAH